MSLEPLVLPGDIDSTDPLDAAEQASRIVRDYCGWHIAPSLTVTLTLDSDGGNLLLLPTLKLTDVAEVIADGCTLDVENDLRWSELGVIELRRHRRFPQGYRTVQVAMTHGWATVPASLIAKCVSVAERVQSRTGVTTQETVGGISHMFGSLGPNVATGFSPDEEAVFNAYRIDPRP